MSSASTVAHSHLIYHYTTADAAFGHILPTRELRLSSLASMRDPVENKEWFRVVRPSPGWPPEKLGDLESAARRLTYETRILSMTMDVPITDPPSKYAHGYARPRMWEHYAERHAGVCLVFDLQELRGTLSAASACFRHSVSGPVIYSDSPLYDHDLARSLNGLTLVIAGDGDHHRGLQGHIQRHAQELFFRKLTDWSSEREYRVVVIDEPNVEIRLNYEKSLRAVILGERFRAWHIPAAQRICSENDIRLLQISWGSESPDLVRLPAST